MGPDVPARPHHRQNRRHSRHRPKHRPLPPGPAAAAEPSIREDHRSATRTAPATRITADGLRNLDDTLALHRAEGRLPSSGSPSARERALAMWLVRRRQDHDRGSLSPTYREGLQEIPGWEQRTRKDNDEKRWNQRLIELTDYMGTGNDWPRHKKTDTEQERLLGMWLHIQRMKYRRDELDHGKEEQLNTLLRGWRDGRTRGRPPGSPNIHAAERLRRSLNCTAVPRRVSPNSSNIY